MVQRIHSLLNLETDPTALIDRDYNIVSANNAFESAYGGASGDVVGHKCYAVTHGFSSPCSEHGEECPMMTALAENHDVKVIHNQDTDAAEVTEVFAHPVSDGSELSYITEKLCQRDVPGNKDPATLVGSSPQFIDARDKCKQVAASNIPILLTGESGVGKERFAGFIHSNSSRSDARMIAVDCCGLSEQLFESELFGHEAGAFTGANKRKTGLIQVADGGTLFLDEIGEIAPAIQAKLLRVLESGEFRRVGGTETLHADIRIVSATNRDLEDMVRNGSFRADLYYRISGKVVQLPSLRTRPDDISALAVHFVRKLGAHSRLSAAALQTLTEYSYPGNVRELRYIMEVASIHAKGGTITEDHLPDFIRSRGQAPAKATRSCAVRTEDTAVRRDEDRIILGMETDKVLATLQKNDGSRRQTAKDLAIPECKLYRLLKRYRERGIQV